MLLKGKGLIIILAAGSNGWHLRFSNSETNRPLKRQYGIEPKGIDNVFLGFHPVGRSARGRYGGAGIGPVHAVDA
ncbi:hypothetical protein [Microvirga pudoricolor]|uniref:hypothetical protein n=1 Tax=Microvirga pudoricolor TaxID=2778729 RepID=UPI00194E4324|nr:hypothetical protein [Microvirga pudoricolor]MBM6595555.1 hypothetical protein [Microvirga pudoricolor]